MRLPGKLFFVDDGMKASCRDVCFTRRYEGDFAESYIAINMGVKALELSCDSIF